MALLQKKDEQIKVGVTPGLVVDATSFVFDGVGGVPDYRGWDIIPFEYGGRSPMIKNLDYSWNTTTGEFAFLQPGDSLQDQQWYTILFQDPITQTFPVPAPFFIDFTYFIRDITIPNIDPFFPRNAPLLDRLNTFIQKFEPQCLEKILGYALYKVVLNESSQRVNDLIFGAEYNDYCGNLRKWHGLIRPEVKISLIANYIYYYFQQSSATQTTGVSTSVEKSEGGKSVSPADKMIKAWNFFSEESENMFWFLCSSPDAYPEFTDENLCYGRRISRKINLFNF